MNLQDLDECSTPSRRIRITAEEIREIARDVEALRNELYEAIKAWKPEQDDEDPDMDILKQCQKWHAEVKHHKNY